MTNYVTSMRYKFRAKDLRFNNWVEGDLVYVTFDRNKRLPKVRPMIVQAYGIGGMIWLGEKHLVDEDTIEIVREE